ncbi:hypothetical protein HF1_02610 [Mycoplasma haemofelis str. Langford 1]|uniref:Uncharacterized protein n=1 Tax=Mycoplasma haemofelis (strain Langford 1) TaxID=941640 RepID=E8ZKV3_MYCHL|nr:hypothetical protein [Mycoplasma haemofelis]CBY92269.1 hypothetical protein HF1_02610 [Mycoplasma haemofelis str. Langford 1]
MSSSLLAKSALGVAGLGTATAGTVYFGRDLIGGESRKEKTSIRKLIQSSNPHKRLISGNNASDQNWKDAWKRYREGHLNKDSDSWNLEGWTRPTGSIGNSDNASTHFISACSSKADIEVENDKDPLYVQVVSYCTRDALISDLIKERNPNKSLLSSESGDEGQWKTVWTSYKDSNPNKEQNGDKWKLSDWNGKQGEDGAPQSFKDECKKRSGTKTVEARSDDYSDTLKWCTK